MPVQGPLEAWATYDYLLRSSSTPLRAYRRLLAAFLAFSAAASLACTEEAAA